MGLRTGMRRRLRDRSDLALPGASADEAARIIGRAAEIDQSLGHDALDEAALAEMGDALGVARPSVRQALAEHHLGVLARERKVRRVLGLRQAYGDALVDGDRDGVEARLDRVLAQEGFDRFTQSATQSRWRSRGWSVRRFLRAFSVRAGLEAAETVEATYFRTGERALGAVRVRLEGRVGAVARLCRSVAGWCFGLAALSVLFAGITLVQGETGATLGFLVLFALPLAVGGLLARMVLARVRSHLREVLDGVLHEL